MKPDRHAGKWAQAILAAQNADGTWGACFHGLAQPGSAPLTTEQALRRLHALGFTREDASIRRCVDTMAACLRGERKIDAYWETGIDWAMYEPLMLAAWIRLFDPEQPDALAYAKRWAKIVESAFSDGFLNVTAWDAAYEAEFHRRERHPRPIRLTALYHAMLLPGVLSAETDRAFVQHILTRPDGMYYVYPQPLVHPPAIFAAKETSYWLSAIELLTEYPSATEQLHFAAAFLRLNAMPDGQWDLGLKANDKVYFPLSDSWRTEALRCADCTERIAALLHKIEKGD
ncbi:MAG: hypothetical protein IJB81_04475 [Clostridia bacterium]|nr:hypothetical protein [Clostridia bacterium]